MIRTKHLVIGLGFVSLAALTSFLAVRGENVTLAVLPDRIIFNEPKDSYGVGSGIKEEAFNRQDFIASVREVLTREKRKEEKNPSSNEVTEKSPLIVT